VTTPSEIDTPQRSARRALTRELLHELNDESVAPRRRRDIRDELVQLHMALVRHAARGIARKSDDVADLAQVGVIGLLHAIDAFDPRRGFEFTTFAYPTISGEMRRHVRDTGWMLRVPRRAKELQRSVRTARDSLAQTLMREPTVAEIADALGESTEHIAEAVTVAGTQAIAPIEGVTSADSVAPAVLRRLASVDAGLEQAEARQRLRPALAALPPLEREIVLRRFYLDKTQSEIAREVAVSQMQVSRLLSRAMCRMRTVLVDGATSAA
jgi:RNA polymerase sigma-B factor